MLIKALCDYADRCEADRNDEAIPDGWCKQDVHFKINLSPDGELVSISDIRDKQTIPMKNGKEKEKLVPRKAVLPERTQKTCIDSNTIEHRPLYIFGLEFDKGSFAVSDKAGKSHIAFVKHELEFFKDLDSEICLAYRRFLEKWNPGSEAENPILLGLGKEYKGSYFRFALSGGKGFLDEDEQFREKYNRTFSEKKNSDQVDEADLQTCGILGEKLPVARIHDKIKFPGGNTVGCVLVGMKESAYESYGKTQSYNSNISEQAMKKYTATLNRLLADKTHRVIIDDMVILFFAMKADDSAECGLICDWFMPSSSDTEMALESMMKRAAEGRTGDTDFEINRDVTFYIAGLTPNSSRICQKFIYRDKFGKIIDNLLLHQQDLRINPDSKREIGFSRIKGELISPKSSNEKVSPPLMTSIILSALNGTNYPDYLLATVIRRVKTDSDEEKNHFIKINDTRIGIIKACINRKLRRAGKKEEFTMSLNLENKNPAYLCGRLFAVYEKIQRDSSGELNRTIKDSYFASACARPSGIMTKLSQLSQNHLRKLSEGSVIYYTKLIGEIMDGLDGGFPQTLDLDSQGSFIVGYYQQSRELYKSKDNK